MIIHQEVYLKTKGLEDEAVIDALRTFAQQTAGWSFMDEQSQEYTVNIGEPSCMLLLDNDEFQPAVGLTKKKDSLYYVANIVPGKSSFIPISEYNAIARRFANDFSGHARSKKILIKVVLSGDKASLKEIIPAPKVRQFFEQYLHAYPTSYHPSDIKRLDVFICAVSRYCRKSVDVEQLHEYLIKDVGWTPKDAEWCHDRIKVGLDILEANKRF
jgi:hypothetical protein